MAEGERLQKVLAHAGVASRRAAERLIVDGRVRLNGVIVRELGVKAAPDDVIEVDGRTIEPAAPLVYYALNKPTGVVSTAMDPKGRTTVVELIGSPERIYPVGRLDWDSEGLLLLTNDGALTGALTHPSHEVEKDYDVWVVGAVGEEVRRRLERGVQLVDGPTAPAGVAVLERTARRSRLLITLHEGRNRQVRRMCDTVGHEVLALRRVRIGPLALGDLARGAWRSLEGAEVAALYGAAGLETP